MLRRRISLGGGRHMSVVDEMYVEFSFDDGVCGP
jgi:hypothetical protein